MNVSPIPATTTHMTTLTHFLVPRAMSTLTNRHVNKHRTSAGDPDVGVASRIERALVQDRTSSGVLNHETGGNKAETDDCAMR